MTIMDLTEKVLSLPVEERIKIADSVYKSLNTFDDEIDGVWAKVASQRATEINDGSSIPVSGPEVLWDLKKLYAQ